LFAVALVLSAGYIFRLFSADSFVAFTLPPPSGSAAPPFGADTTPLPSGEVAKASSMVPVVPLDISVDNVQVVVADMTRPETYQCEWAVEWLWEGGSRTAKRRVIARDGYTKIEIYNPDGTLRQSLIHGDGRTFLIGLSLWQPAQGDITPESSAALPAYETILGLDISDLREAEFRIWEGMPCVYVSFRADDVNTDAYMLNLDDGLPFWMERRADGKTVYRCTRLSLHYTRASDDAFRLPNNQLAWDY